MQHQTEKITIYGPPGSGKTRELIDHLRNESRAIGMENVLFCTYLKSTAIELKEKIRADFFPHMTKEEFDEYAYDNLKIGTIHSLCFRLLGLGRKDVVKEIHRLAFCRGQGYQYKTSMYEKNEEDLPDGFKEKEIGNSMFSILDALRERMLPIRMWKTVYDGKYVGMIDDTALSAFSEAWKKFKTDQGKMDFTDMVEKVYNQRLSFGINTLILDEAQDLTKLRYEIIKIWEENAKKSIWAGDDDQNVFAHAGAESRFMLERGPDKTRILEKTFRLPLSVHGKLKRFIETIKKRQPKNFVPASLREGFWKNIVFTGVDSPRHGDRIRYLLKQNPMPEHGLFCLFRANYMVKMFADALIEEGIPFRLVRNHGVWSDRLVHINNAIYKLEKKQDLNQKEAVYLFGALPVKGIVVRGKKTEILRSEPNDIFPFHETVGYFVRPVTPTFLKNAVRVGSDKNDRARLALLRHDGLISKINISIGTMHSSKGLERQVTYVFMSIPPKVLKGIYSSVDTEDNEKRVFYTAASRCFEGNFIVYGFFDNSNDMSYPWEL